MTDDILALIRDNKKSHLYLPRVLFADKAQSYLKRGIFVPTNQWYREIDCPNGCGELAPVRKKGPGRYIAVCTHGAVTEEIEVAADEVELCEFDPVAFKCVATRDEQRSMAKTNKGGKKYDKSLTKDWTQKKAAALLGISERQLRTYKTKPPDAHWPGWEDPVALQQWMNQREDRDLMAQALSRRLPYRETVTERSMKK